MASVSACSESGGCTLLHVTKQTPMKISVALVIAVLCLHRSVRTRICSPGLPNDEGEQPKSVTYRDQKRQCLWSQSENAVSLLKMPMLIPNYESTLVSRPQRISLTFETEQR